MVCYNDEQVGGQLRVVLLLLLQRKTHSTLKLLRYLRNFCKFPMLDTRSAVRKKKLKKRLFLSMRVVIG